MKLKLYLIVMLSVALNAWAQQPQPPQQPVTLPGLPEGKITVHAVGEDAAPIPGVKVKLAFQEPKPQWGSPRENPVTGFTDNDGKFSGSGPCPLEIGGKAELSGYYLSFLPKYHFTDVQAGKCQPWNPTVDVLLKKIINPIPMYAKKVRAVVPAMDQPIGFDLAVGDWVRPFGAGTNSDFIFTFSRTSNDPTDYSIKLLLAFTGKGDGVQVIPKGPDQGASLLKLPRNAPDDGYEATWSTTLNHGSFGTNAPQPGGLGYYFRLRSVLQDDGKAKQGLYGKIDGNINIVGAAADHPGITFTYYFNPTGTTNLEFDPTKNLLKNLKEDEQVQAP